MPQCNVNTEQASKVLMQEPTRSLFGEGRRHPGKLPGSKNDPARMNLPGYWWQHVSIGNWTQHGKPQRWERVTLNRNIRKEWFRAELGWRKGS